MEVASTAGIEFGDSDDFNAGFIVYDNSDNSLAFGVNGAGEKVRIASNGGLCVNSTSADNNVHIGITSSSTGIILKAAGDHHSLIDANSNRASAGNTLHTYLGRWNGTQVASMRFVTGSDTTNKDDGLISFSTSSADNLTERMRIDSAGNMLINTTISVGKLTLKGTNNSGSSCYVVTNSGKAGQGIDLSCTTVGDGNFGGAISFGCGGNGRSAIAAVQSGSDDDKNGLAFFTHDSTTGSDNAAEVMRLTSNGRLGIGTTSPDHLFEVEDNNSSIATSRTGANAQLLFKSNSVGQCGQIQVSESSGGGVMQFFTKTTAGTVTEHLRINTDGKLKIDIDDSNTSRVNATHLQIQNSNFGASTCAGIMLAASNGANSEFNILTQKHASGSGADFHLDNGTDAMIQISGDNGDIKFGVSGSMIDTFTPGNGNNTTGVGLEPRNGNNISFKGWCCLS